MKAESEKKQAENKIDRLKGRDKTTGRFLKNREPWNKGLKGWQKNKAPNLFKKGHIPWTRKPIGAETTDKDGYIRVKVSNDKNKNKRWKLKQHIIYEQNHPDIKIGKTDRIIFLDGNKRNFDINNLKLVTLREQMALSHYGKLTNAEETRALINLIRIRIKLLDFGTDRRYNYQKKYNQKYPDKLKESARKSAKKKRGKIKNYKDKII